MTKVVRSSKMSQEGNSIADDGLVLYHHPASYFSQKVYFALKEKKLKFRSHHVNLLEGEHLQPWFLKLNPKAQIPVLKDGVKVIPESDAIIDYLEDNFSNGETPRLKPDKGTPQYEAMERFQKMLSKIKILTIAFGCIAHPELTQDRKISAEETNFLDTTIAKVEELTEKHKELKNAYAAKKDEFLKIKKDVENIENVKKAINELGSVLETIEKELASREGDKEKWWLSGEKFTVVDISLSILLTRITQFGLWNNFFGDAKLPKLNNYFKCVRMRNAYKKTMHQSSGIMGKICCLGTKEKLAVSLSTAVIVLGVAGLALFIVQRNK